MKDPNAPKRAPSGFAKPTKVSKELEQFLGLSDGEEIARTEVTRRVNAYVKEHNLQNPANKRQLVLNDTLQALLNPPADVTVTFFNLQT